MNRSVAVLLCVLAALVGLTGGYVLRGTAGASPEGGKERGDAAGRGATGSAKASHRQTSHTLQVKSNVERSEGSHYWLQWMSGVESATLADLPGLARMARDNPGALRLIAYRWIELDPEHLYEALKTERKFLDHSGEGSNFPCRRLARYLFEEWPKRDPAASIAALAAPDAMLGLSGLRHTVLNTVFQDDPRRGLELMNEWSIFHFGPNTDGLKEWARREPQAAARAAFDNPVGYGAESSMKSIAKVWAEQDPAAAMTFALQESGRLSHTLRDTVLAEWAGRDRAAAAEWLAGQDDEALRSQLSPVIVEAWAKEDPQAALSWCEENLEGHRLVAAVEKLAKGAAENDVHSAAALLAGMDPSPARTQAAIAVGATWFPQSWPSEQNVEPEAVEWIRSLGDPELQGAVLEKVGWGWATQDREGLMDFLTTPHGARASASVYNVLMQSLARDDPHRALEWAAGLPAERVQQASRTAVSVWANHQPAAAFEWLVALPASDHRRSELLRSVVTTMSFQVDSGVVIERLRALAPTDRALAREQIERAEIPDEKRELLLQAVPE